MATKLITEALASIARGDLDQAQALAREAVARAPDRADAWRTLGLALQTAERHL